MALLKNGIRKNLSSEQKEISRIKKYLANPMSQFIILGVIIVLSVLITPLIGLAGIPNAIGNTVVYAVIAIGFCLLLGYSGLASLGTAGFAGVGAFAAYYAMHSMGMSFLTALILAILAAFVIGMIVGFISLRIEGLYLGILTLGLAEILFEVFLLQGGSISLGRREITLFFSVLNEQGVIIVITVLFVILLILTKNLIDSPTGRAMLAMKNSTSAAQAMGVSLLKYRLLAFIISTIYASIGGMLHLLLNTYINLSDGLFLNLSMSLNILGAVIVGGSKSLWGTIFGALVIFGIQNIFLINIPFFAENKEFMSIVSGILIIVVVMFYPGGLAQLAIEVKGKIKAAISKRREKKYGTY